jgi:hypothetical protein
VTLRLRKEQIVREPSSYPAGVPCWIDTAQPEPQEAADFYRALFGWEFEQQPASAQTGTYLVATMGGAPVGAITTPADGSDPAQWTSYVRVDAVDDAVEAITGADGRILVGPVDHADAGRRAVCADAGGAAFGVVQTHGPLVAQRVNEPGTWNFSELLTSDPDRALDFYRQVFGWEAAVVDLGTADDTWMWRRPGYSDVLEQHDPGVRKRHIDFGAPPGFTDAVGWMSPPTDEQSAATPTWHITFAVADADAVAARTQELGGTVLVPPTDAGMVRTTVLRDPQGATFTASKFDPS